VRPGDETSPGSAVPGGGVPVRTLLVTGAGGAGRTTAAAATALAAARRGARTLLLTGDRAVVDPLLPPAVPGAPAGHGNGDGSGRRGEVTATGLPLPSPVADVDLLYVARVDPAASYRAGALDVQARIGSLLAMLGAPPLDPEELTELPGAEAFALLRALREARAVPAEGGGAGGDPADGPGAPLPGAGWDLVVVDLPPVREAVALLALPEQLRRYLRRLLPADRQAARALRPVLAQLAGVPMPAEWAYDAATRADRELAAVQRVIDAAGTAVAVVLDPSGPSAADVLSTARTGLALHGHRLAGVLADRVLPTGSADPFLAALSAEQQDVLTSLAAQCAEHAGHGVRAGRDGHDVRADRTGHDPRAGRDGHDVRAGRDGHDPHADREARAVGDGHGVREVPHHEIPHLGRAPRTPADLAALADALDAAGWPAGAVPGFGHGPAEGGVTGGAAEPDAPRPDPWHVADRLAAEGHLVWTLPLPGAGREGLDLVRRGDELVVDAGGFRRIVPLPSALRRCTVAGAALRDGALRVRFTPDPGLWPR
jgi:arsenite-transporting ATPase